MVVLQQAQIDDATAEDLAFLCEALRDGGALDVFCQPVLMKKGRAGTLVSALVRPDQRHALRQVWWRHGTSLGLREHHQARWVLRRHHQTLSTPLGSVRLKWAGPDPARPPKPEFEDLAALAREHQLPLAAVRRQVALSLEAQLAQGDPTAAADSEPSP